MSRISGGGAIVQEDAIRDRTKLSVAATAFGLSAAVSILFNTGLACVKDAYPPVFRFMMSLTGHHWITHAAIVLLVFGVCAGIFSRRTMEASKLIKTIVAGVVLSGLVIVAFYLIAG